MGIEGMQASLRNNKRERKSIFDSKKKVTSASYNDFVDDKKMTTYEFHEFQKKIKQENYDRHKKFLIKSVSTIILLLAVVIYFLFFYSF